MNIVQLFSKHSFAVGVALKTACCMALSFAVNANANPTYSMKDFESFPINIVQNTTKPKVVINSSNDHQLFFKAYNDYSDLDGDGVKETTYKHGIDYYGYFDSYKCYSYDGTNKLYTPKSLTTDKYCNVTAGNKEWSGNFLNWASMSRIDTIRKILFGGHRRVDTTTATVLERAYLPHDAHSWAKYYDGADIQKLTPFVRGTDYYCDQGDLSGCTTSGVLDRQKIGITIGNTTDLDHNNALLYKKAPVASQEYVDPPLIKAVKGNYSLWASNERWQVTWGSGAPYDNHSASNDNNTSISGIFAYSSSPDYSQGMGEKNYVARVAVCVSGLIGRERCKTYPGADKILGNSDDTSKPIGLLQTYGDSDEMEFAMIAGSYAKHTSGGVVIKTMGRMADEINVDTDGVFYKVYVAAGGPETDKNKAGGLINAWSLYRIIGYDILDSSDPGTYNNADGCKWGLSAFNDISGNNCRNWGNPFSEIYYQSINYLAGGGVIGDYRSNSSTGIEGLPVPQSLAADPLSSTDYCAQLNVINLNSSIFSYDADDIDSNSYGPTKLWDPVVLPGGGTVSEMTDVVGNGEKIHGKSFYIGEKDVLTGIKGPEDDDQLCTPKTIDSLGDAGGHCPEGPRVKGSFSIAGLAYYAHTQDIRSDKYNRKLPGIQTVDTYSVAFATTLPLLEIPDPDDATKTIATIIPACRNSSLNPKGNCALVDYKIINQSKYGGEVFIVWEDSEQGGDYDQDMWGSLKYTINATKTQITVTTDVVNESTVYKMGFGYVIGGTTNDGFHAHSGIEGYTRSETADSGSPNCSSGCNPGDSASTKTYTLGSAPADLLKDPLWYAAKWGGYTEKNGILGPDQQDEWDARINDTWSVGQDNIPDNYFFASNPTKLEEALDRVLSAILERSSSGTAAAVVSSNVRGEGALFQAYYEPLKKDGAKEARWIGTLQSLWLDSYGLTRQDCSLDPTEKYDSSTNPTGYDPATATECPKTPLKCGPSNGQLDDYCIDNVIETYYDDIEDRTRVKVFNSSAPDKFTAYSMQGVVDTYATGLGTGAVSLKPNSMEGVLSWNSTNWHFQPYSITGRITAYDSNGLATVDFGSWVGKTGSSYSNWRGSILSSDTTIYPDSYDSFHSGNTIPLTTSTIQIQLTPVDPAIAAALASATPPVLTVVLETRNVVGHTGDTFEDWDVECIDGPAETGVIAGNSLVLNNNEDQYFVITNKSTTPFASCNSVRLSSYGADGPIGESYSSWDVANLDTIFGGGESADTLTLANSGNLSLNVSPTLDWLNLDDRVLLTNYSFTTKEIYQINYLWNAREELTRLPEANLYTNRTVYDSKANVFGRYIMTWIDKDLDGVVDRDLITPANDEYKPFQRSSLNAVNYNFLDTSSMNEAGNVIEFIRGVEVAGTRSRKIKYAPTDLTEGVMRLGDIINSTPTVVGSPQESFDLLYSDSSYSVFRKKYKSRRVVVYVGGNDGLLHAFNGGFYDVTTGSSGTDTVKYNVQGKKSDDITPATEHALGAELWAYAPKNLLPHLRWLADGVGYPKSHVYYMDGKPRIFEAKIFQEETACSTPSSLACIHPKGWGTVMVVGMNLGGGKIDVDADSNNDNIIDTTHAMRSAYVVFDITDPETEPQVLGEIPVPDGSFSTVYPAVAAFRNAKTGSPDKWYLVFGNGPDNSKTGIDTYESTQNARLYMFDLSQLKPGAGAVSPTLGAKALTTCSIQTLTPSPYQVVACDSGVANSFMGTPAVVDWQLDYLADSTYFGIVGDDSSTSGRVMRLDYNNTHDANNWDGLENFFITNRPVVGQAVPAIDNLSRRWLYFGTGRHFSVADKSSTPQHTLYGVREEGSATAVATTSLIDVTNVEVDSEGNMVSALSGAPLTGSVSTFKALEAQVNTNTNIKGWKLNLPMINGTLGTDPSTRNTTRSTLLGGVLFTSVFQPSLDSCEGEGESRLYGLYYKTGTAYPDPSVLGSTTVSITSNIRYISNKFIELGRGVATAPAIHSGTGSGSDTVRVFTQLSTGDIVQATADTVDPVRTGKTSWSDRDK